MTEIFKERLCNVENDIGEIKTSIAVINTNVVHIVERLNTLCCNAHSEKIEQLQTNVFGWKVATTLIGIIVGIISGVMAIVR